MPVLHEVKPLGPDGDGRQSETARDIARGVARCLRAHGFAVLPEVTLRSGRRADLIAVSAQSDVWIVEIKSSVEDFRADLKWPDYRADCDRLFFAVKPDFPHAILPEDAGLIVADRYGAEVVRMPAVHAVPAARRKALLTLIAMTAAFRLTAAGDPDFKLDERL